MVSVAALALIAGTGLANAQGMKGGEAGGNAMQHSAPAENSAAPSKSDSSAGPARSETSAPKGGMKSTQSEPKSPGTIKNDRAEDNVKGGSTSQRAEDRGKAGTTNQRAEENMKSGSKAESRDNNMKAEGRDRDHDKNMKAEGRDRDRDNMKAEGRDSKSGTNAAETKSTTERSQTTGQAGAGAKLTTEQRTKITTVIHNERVAPVTNVNFSVSVGTRVPREGITLHRLPSEVVTIYPEWRSYEYIVVRSQIIVIDPGTYEIVAILDA
jgi:hypothetical protein